MTPIIGILASSMTAGQLGSYESIATVSVGLNGQANVEFTSIPATYTHLQIRYLAKTESANNADYFKVRFNGNTTTSNYRSHALSGDGTGVYSETAANDLQIGALSGNGTLDAFAVGVIDILDYRNTNKNTTIRAIGGFNKNSATANTQWIGLASGLFIITDAITSITFTTGTGSDIAQYSHFALYGIKG